MSNEISNRETCYFDKVNKLVNIWIIFTFTKQYYIRISDPGSFLQYKYCTVELKLHIVAVFVGKIH